MLQNFFNIIRAFNRLKPSIVFFFLLISAVGFSQERKMVEILRAGTLESNEKIVANAQRLIDSVLIKHKNVLIWCDSLYNYNGTNRVDAFGHVHLKQGDTLHLYARTIMYDGDKSFAQAWGDVHLINKTTNIYTDTLDYDLAAKVSYYDDKGKIVDSLTTITSQIGKYFVESDLMYLYRDVVGVNKNFMLESDTVNYNTKTGRIFINGPTTIRDTASTLYAERGWYDSKTGEAELLKRPLIWNATQKISAEYINYKKNTKAGIARGKVRIEDQQNQSIILGRVAEYNDSLETAMVTDSAIYINYNDADTLYLHADTLRTVPDTLEGEKIINAYYGVRFFRSDLQGICDSMVYFTKDSVIQLHNNPVIWSENRQISSDLIELRQYTNAPDQLYMNRNSFIISKQDSGKYDQIKGKEMIGYIVNKKLRNIDVDGNGQTLYYAREKEEIVGLNRAESSKISITFKDGEFYKIVFLKSPEGELKPLFELTEEEKKLPGFEWKIYLRPLSKYDIFERNTAKEREEIMNRQKQKQELGMEN